MVGRIRADLPLLGQLPDSWAIVTFGELLDGPTRNGVYKPKKFHGTGAKMINMGELFAFSRIEQPEMKRVQLSTKELDRFAVQAGDLLFARRSLVAEGAGKCSLVLGDGEPRAFESSIIRARPDKKKAVPAFLYYLFSSTYGRFLMSSILRQVAVSGIASSDLVNLEVPLPPLSEQRTIASILGALDDKIESNRRMNETLEEMARALFKSWFVDFDPVRAKMEGRRPFGMDDETAALFSDSFEDSAQGEIPKGWTAGTVGDDFNITMGQSPPGETYNEIGEGLPFYQGRRDFKFRYPTLRVYCSAPKRTAQSGDTLVSVRAPVGDVNMAESVCCVGRGVAAVRHKTGSRSYTYYAMRSLGSYFERFESEGTVFGAVNKQGFATIPFLLPPPALIERFESSIFPLDQRIEVQEKQSRTLATIRDALLPKLLSGEVRVEEVEGIVNGAF